LKIKILKSTKPLKLLKRANINKSIFENEKLKKNKNKLKSILIKINTLNKLI
jgi:hypothetical protein